MNNYCPECRTKGRQVPVKKHQLTDNYYLVLCTDKENCTFHESGEGEAQVDKEYLKDFGIPGELLEFMDIYQEDLANILCLAVHEYFMNTFLRTSNNSTNEWKIVLKLFKDLASKFNMDVELPNFDVAGPNEFIVTTRAIESSIADISIDYQTTVKTAFSKIKNYKFPDDLIKSLFSKENL